MLIQVTSNSQALILFSQKFPTLVNNAPPVNSIGIVMDQDVPDSTCAGLFFVGNGTVAEIAVKEYATSADAARTQTRTILTTVTSTLLSWHLLTPTTTSAPPFLLETVHTR